MSDPLAAHERDALLASLASESEEVRRLAVEQLVLLPAEEAVDHLLARLGDGSWRVRKAVVERLVANRAQERVRAGLLVALADGENPGRRNAAFEALVALGIGATESLIAGTRSPDADVRKLAVDALAAIGDTRVGAALAESLADPDVNVRAAAADALGSVGAVGAMEALIERGSDAREVPLVRLSALRALDQLGAELTVERLADALAHPQLRPAALELLGHSAEPASRQELEKALTSPMRAVRDAAISALMRQQAQCDPATAEGFAARLRVIALAEPDLVPRCCEGLEGLDLARRVELVEFLALVGDERAVRPLLFAGRDEALADAVEATLVHLGGATVAVLGEIWSELDSDLVLRGCDLLGRIGGEQAEELLARALESDGVATVARAARALGQGASFRCLAELVRRLELAVREEGEEQALLVEALVDALVALAERSAASDSAAHVQLIEVLSSRLAGAAAPLRVAIARTLACVGRERDGDVIQYLMRDASPQVRRAAVPALARLAPAQAQAALRLALGDEASGVRIAAVGLIAQTGGAEALDDLARLARDGDTRVAAAAARAVGALVERVGDAGSHDLGWLDGVLAREPFVALAAVESLMRIGGSRATSGAAITLARPEPELVRAAIDCLARHASNDELSALAALLGHQDWSVRAEAAKALSARRWRRALPAILRRLELEEDAFVREALLDAARRLEE